MDEENQWTVEECALNPKGAADRIEADAKVIEAAKALRADVLEVQAYRAQCAHGSVNLSALALKMRAVEETLAAFNEALDASEKG